MIGPKSKVRWNPRWGGTEGEIIERDAPGSDLWRVLITTGKAAGRTVVLSEQILTEIEDGQNEH